MPKPLPSNNPTPLSRSGVIAGQLRADSQEDPFESAVTPEDRRLAGKFDVKAAIKKAKNQRRK